MAPADQQQSTQQIKNGEGPPGGKEMEPLGCFLTALGSACFFNVWTVSDSYSSRSSGPAVCHM